MNNDLISREALKEEMQKVYPLATNGFGNQVNSEIYKIIDNAPTVNAFTEDDMSGAYNEGYSCGSRENEKSKGKWIIHNDYNESCRYGCNQCGNLTNIPGNFCPNCGALMQKGGAE